MANDLSLSKHPKELFSNQSLDFFEQIYNSDRDGIGDTKDTDKDNDGFEDTKIVASPGIYKDNQEQLPAGSYLDRINLNDGSPVKEGWLYITY